MLVIGCQVVFVAFQYALVAHNVKSEILFSNQIYGKILEVYQIWFLSNGKTSTFSRGLVEIEATDIWHTLGSVKDQQLVGVEYLVEVKWHPLDQLVFLFVAVSWYFNPILLNQLQFIELFDYL